MDPKKAQDMANRMKKVGKGGGIGIGVLAAAGAAAYGISQSFYTGAYRFKICRISKVTCII